MFPANKKSARLGQWDGRTRSSRSEGPLWPRLWQRPVLLRLSVVLSTALLATLLAVRWGPGLLQACRGSCWCRSGGPEIRCGSWSAAAFFPAAFPPRVRRSPEAV